MARENKNWAKAKFTPILKKKLFVGGKSSKVLSNSYSPTLKSAKKTGGSSTKRSSK
jgi:hypothetical protein